MNTGYQTLTLKLGQTTLTKDISDLTYSQQVLVVERIRKRLLTKLKKKTWVPNLWGGQFLRKLKEVLFVFR